MCFGGGKEAAPAPAPKPAAGPPPTPVTEGVPPSGAQRAAGGTTPTANLGTATTTKKSLLGE